MNAPKIAVRGVRKAFGRRVRLLSLSWPAGAGCGLGVEPVGEGFCARFTSAGPNDGCAPPGATRWSVTAPQSRFAGTL